MESPGPRALLLLAEIPSPLALDHTPDTRGLALGGRKFLHSGDLGCCHREDGWKVLEMQVRQAVGQAYHSRDKAAGPEEKAERALRPPEPSVC